MHTARSAQQRRSPSRRHELTRRTGDAVTDDNNDGDDDEDSNDSAADDAGRSNRQGTGRDREAIRQHRDRATSGYSNNDRSRDHQAANRTAQQQQQTQTSRQQFNYDEYDDDDDDDESFNSQEREVRQVYDPYNDARSSSQLYDMLEVDANNPMRQAYDSMSTILEVESEQASSIEDALTAQQRLRPAGNARQQPEVAESPEAAATTTDKTTRTGSQSAGTLLNVVVDSSNSAPSSSQPVGRVSPEDKFGGTLNALAAQMRRLQAKQQQKEASRYDVAPEAVPPKKQVVGHTEVSAGATAAHYSSADRLESKDPDSGDAAGAPISTSFDQKQQQQQRAGSIESLMMINLSPLVSPRIRPYPLVGPQYNPSSGGAHLEEPRRVVEVANKSTMTKIDLVLMDKICEKYFVEQYDKATQSIEFDCDELRYGSAAAGASNGKQSTAATTKPLMKSVAVGTEKFSRERFSLLPQTKTRSTQTKPNISDKDIGTSETRRFKLAHLDLGRAQSSVSAARSSTQVNEGGEEGVRDIGRRDNLAAAADKEPQQRTGAKKELDLVLSPIESSATSNNSNGSDGTRQDDDSSEVDTISAVGNDRPRRTDTPSEQPGKGTTATSAQTATSRVRRPLANHSDDSLVGSPVAGEAAGHALGRCDANEGSGNVIAAESKSNKKADAPAGVPEHKYGDQTSGSGSAEQTSGQQTKSKTPNEPNQDSGGNKEAMRQQQQQQTTMAPPIVPTLKTELRVVIEFGDARQRQRSEIVSNSQLDNGKLSKRMEVSSSKQIPITTTNSSPLQQQQLQRRQQPLSLSTVAAGRQALPSALGTETPPHQPAVDPLHKQQPLEYPPPPMTAAGTASPVTGRTPVVASPVASQQSQWAASTPTRSRLIRRSGGWEEETMTSPRSSAHPMTPTPRQVFERLESIGQAHSLIYRAGAEAAAGSAGTPATPAAVVAANTQALKRQQQQQQSAVAPNKSVRNLPSQMQRQQVAQGGRSDIIEREAGTTPSSDGHRWQEMSRSVVCNEIETDYNKRGGALKANECVILSSDAIIHPASSSVGAGIDVGPIRGAATGDDDTGAIQLRSRATRRYLAPDGTLHEQVLVEGGAGFDGPQRQDLVGQRATPSRMDQGVAAAPLPSSRPAVQWSRPLTPLQDPSGSRDLPPRGGTPQELRKSSAFARGPATPPSRATGPSYYTKDGSAQRQPLMIISGEPGQATESASGRSSRLEIEEEIDERHQVTQNGRLVYDDRLRERKYESELVSAGESAAVTTGSQMPAQPTRDRRTGGSSGAGTGSNHIATNGPPQRQASSSLSTTIRPQSILRTSGGGTGSAIQQQAGGLSSQTNALTSSQSTTTPTSNYNNSNDNGQHQQQQRRGPIAAANLVVDQTSQVSTDSETMDSGFAQSGGGSSSNIVQQQHTGGASGGPGRQSMATATATRLVSSGLYPTAGGRGPGAHRPAMRSAAATAAAILRGVSSPLQPYQQHRGAALASNLHPPYRSTTSSPQHHRTSARHAEEETGELHDPLDDDGKGSLTFVDDDIDELIDQLDSSRMLSPPAAAAGPTAVKSTGAGSGRIGQHRPSQQSSPLVNGGGGKQVAGEWFWSSRSGRPKSAGLV